MDFNYKVRPIAYTTSWLKRLNKDLQKALKIRSAISSVDLVVFLLSATTTRHIEEPAYSYTIQVFENKPILNHLNTNFLEIVIRRDVFVQKQFI
ncbi:MAG: hypothetical protein AAF770_02100 [Bacteroidota bacterium]